MLLVIGNAQYVVDNVEKFEIQNRHFVRVDYFCYVIVIYGSREFNGNEPRYSADA